MTTTIAFNLLAVLKANPEYKTFANIDLDGEFYSTATELLNVLQADLKNYKYTDLELTLVDHTNRSKITVHRFVIISYFPLLRSIISNGTRVELTVPNVESAMDVIKESYGIFKKYRDCYDNMNYANCRLHFGLPADLEATYDLNDLYFRDLLDTITPIFQTDEREKQFAAQNSAIVRCIQRNLPLNDDNFPSFLLESMNKPKYIILNKNDRNLEFVDTFTKRIYNQTKYLFGKKMATTVYSSNYLSNYSPNYSSDNQLIAIFTKSDNTLNIITNKQISAHVLRLEPFDKILVLHTFDAISNHYNAKFLGAVFSPDRTNIAMLIDSSTVKYVAVYNIPNKEWVWTEILSYYGKFSSIVYTPDQKYILCNSTDMVPGKRYGECPVTDLLYFLDAETGKIIKEINLKTFCFKYKHYKIQMQLSPNGKFLAFKTNRKNIHPKSNENLVVYKLTISNEIECLPLIKSQCPDRFSFSPDNKLIVVNEFNSILITNLETDFMAEHIFFHQKNTESKVEQIRYSLDGKSLLMMSRHEFRQIDLETKSIQTTHSNKNSMVGFIEAR